MRSLAIGLVMAWWFAQLRLDLVGGWWVRREPAQVAGLVAALLLGGWLQHAIGVRRRGHTVPLVPVLALGGMAAWLLLGPLVVGKAGFYSSSARVYAEWGMAIVLAAGSAWIALRLAPPDEPVIGPDASAPTLRLALALGVLLSACMVLWSPPWGDSRSLSELTAALQRAAGSDRETAGQQLARWFVTALPYLLAAALVWGAKLGPRILAAKPGLTRMTVYLVGWGIAQVFILYASLRYGEAARSPGGDVNLAGLLVAAMFLGPLVPLLNAVLLWAVFRMLFSLGRAEDEAMPAARVDAPVAPAKPRAAADQGALNEIKRLLSERKSAAALACYARTLDARPDFDPGTSSVVPLAKQALKERRADLALRLLEIFGQRRPADTRTPLFRWLHGQALIGAGRQAEGLAELQALMLHDAQDPLAREARSLLAQHGAS
jgi:hypothetical protein